MISLMGFIMSSKLVTSQDLQFSFSQGLYSDWMKALILYLYLYLRLRSFETLVHFLDIKDVTYIMNIKGGLKDIIMNFN